MAFLYLGLAYSWFAVMALLIPGTCYAVFVLRRARRKPLPPDAKYPPISVLKPLCGMDIGLRDNLRSFFTLDYPEFELIFSTHTPDDPALVIAKELIAEYPKVSSRMVVSGPCLENRNPKVINTAPAYEIARHEWVFMADSTLRVKPDFLKKAATYFDDKVGLVSAIATTANGSGVGGMLEHLVMNTFVVRCLLYSSRVLRLPYVWGKAAIFRKSVADSFGGLGALDIYLAEDFALGIRIQRAGYKAVLMDELTEEWAWSSTFMDFWKRHLRWARTRRFFSSAVPWLALIGTHASTAVVGAIGFKGAFGVSPLKFLAFNFVIWFACDMIVFRAIGRRITPKVILAWFGRDLVEPCLCFASMVGSTVEWKGRKFVLQGKETCIIPASLHRSWLMRFLAPAGYS